MYSMVVTNFRFGLIHISHISHFSQVIPINEIEKGYIDSFLYLDETIVGKGQRENISSPPLYALTSLIDKYLFHRNQTTSNSIENFHSFCHLHNTSHYRIMTWVCTNKSIFTGFIGCFKINSF